MALPVPAVLARGLPLYLFVFVRWMTFQTLALQESLGFSMSPPSLPGGLSLTVGFQAHHGTSRRRHQQTRG